ncbi:MAG TPA: DNA polymerase Y family protein [Acidimicrobiales bacterium]|nr:DNA polymerase Y family protein [Acidimicrobiales bacterium]
MRPERLLVATLPDWPVVAAGCSPDVPAAVVAANRVVAATAAARAEGVRPGLRRREAQGRCPELAVVAADPGRDARGWEPVVAAVESLTPAVEVLAPGALSLVTRGPSRYFGGDAALGQKVADVVDRTVKQVAGRVGIADGRFAAHLAARVAGTGGTGPVLVVPPGGSREWLAPYPVRVLGPEQEDLADLLTRLGVRTLGDLAGLPGPSVLGRFGAAGAAAHRLAQGRDDRSLAARTPPPDLVVTAELDPPEQRIEAAAFVVKALADELQGRLGLAGLACTKVAIEAETEHGEHLVRHWRHEGTLTAAAMSERARWQLDGWLVDTGGGSGPTAGLTLLRLTPEEVRPDRGRQLGFWGGQADSDVRAARALNRVQGLLGPDSVLTAVLGGGRGFAEQVRLVPWGDDRDIESAAGSSRKSGRDGRSSQRARPDGSTTPRPSGSRVESPAPWPGRLSNPAPAVVHHGARPAELRDLDGRFVEVSGRGAMAAAPSAISIEGGPWLAVRAWAGPWPLEERWWEGGGRRRARLQVLLEDGEAHLVSRESGRWWVEATYG